MSIETVRQCDDCLTIVDTGDELWTIGVVAVLNANPVQPFPSTFNRGMRATNNNRLLKDHWKDLCRPCMDKKGLAPMPVLDEPAKEPDTLDELLQELVEEKVHDALEGER